MMLKDEWASNPILNIELRYICTEIIILEGILPV